MNKKLFSELVESMTQMNEIVRGKRALAQVRGRCNYHQSASREDRAEPTEVRRSAECRRRDAAQLGARPTRAHRPREGAVDRHQ